MLAFMPDAPENTPDVLVEVEAVPTVRGYKGVPTGTDAGYAAISAACTGAALCYKLDGTFRLFAGTTSEMYEGVGGSWSTVTDGTGYPSGYSTGDVRWRFAQFGDTTIAVNIGTKLQYSTTGDFASNDYAPKAACIDTASGFVVVANCDDTGTSLTTGYGLQQNRWWCSQIFNATGSWAPSVTTQATSGLLVDSPGPIRGLRRLGGDIVVYQDQALSIGRYVGPPEVFRFSRVPSEVGAAAQEAVVNIGNAHIFVGYDDFYMFDGSRPIVIGQGVKEWFFKEVNKSYLFKIAGMHDYLNGAVWWWYPPASGSDLTRAIIYNYKSQRWGHATITIEQPVQVITDAISYENFYSTATYDTLPSLSYDSPFWQGSAPVLAYFNGSHALTTLTGTPGTTSLKTGYVGDDDAVSLLHRVRPRFRTVPATATITPRKTMQIGDTPTACPSANINDDRFDVLQKARWHGLTLEFTGEVEIEAILPSLRRAGRE